MVSQTILLYALFAGLVAILVTVAIEKFGGIIGGVLGTIPSTIIPAAAGVYSIDGTGSLRDSMSMVPIDVDEWNILISLDIFSPTRKAGEIETYLHNHFCLSGMVSISNFFS